jgi:hypothetical protein
MAPQTTGITLRKVTLLTTVAGGVVFQFSSTSSQKALTGFSLASVAFTP